MRRIRRMSKCEQLCFRLVRKKLVCLIPTKGDYKRSNEHNLEGAAGSFGHHGGETWWNLIRTMNDGIKINEEYIGSSQQRGKHLEVAS